MKDTTFIKNFKMHISDKGISIQMDEVEYPAHIDEIFIKELLQVLQKLIQKFMHDKNNRRK